MRSMAVGKPVSRLALLLLLPGLCVHQCEQAGAEYHSSRRYAQERGDHTCCCRIPLELSARRVAIQPGHHRGQLEDWSGCDIASGARWTAHGPDDREDLSIGTIEPGPLQFRVAVRTGDGNDERVLLQRTITTPHRWEKVPLDLASFAGQSIRLEFATRSDTHGTLAFWGSPLHTSRTLRTTPYGRMPPAKRKRQAEQVRKVITQPFLRRFAMPSRDELLKAKVDPEPYVDSNRAWYDGAIRGLDAEVGEKWPDIGDQPPLEHDLVCDRHGRLETGSQRDARPRTARIRAVRVRRGPVELDQRRGSAPGRRRPIVEGSRAGGRRRPRYIR